MKGRMPFPDPITPIAIIAGLGALVVPTCLKILNRDHEGGNCNTKVERSISDEAKLKVDTDIKNVSEPSNANEGIWIDIVPPVDGEVIEFEGFVGYGPIDTSPKDVISESQADTEITK